MRTCAVWSSTRADAGARLCPLEGGALALRVLQVDASDDELNPGVGDEFGVTGFPTVLGWAADVDDDSAEASKRGGQCCPAREENKKREARVGESFSRDRALLRSAGASQAHYVSRLRFATLRKEPLLACQDLGIKVYFMLFRNQTLRNC